MKNKLAVMGLLWGPSFCSLVLLLVLACPSRAQSITLPTTRVDFTNYGGAYANLFASDIPVTINGVPFNVSINGHFVKQADGSVPCVSTCNIQFWNLQTEAQDNVTYTGDVSGLPLKSNTTVNATFSDASFTGSFTLNLVFIPPLPGCTRFCFGHYNQEGSTITVDSGVASLYRCGSKRVPCKLSAEQCFKDSNCVAVPQHGTCWWDGKGASWKNIQCKAAS